MISSLEDYLDNIFKVEVQGDTRLDKAIDRMVKQQEEFLSRFHQKVGQVLETTMGNAANKMVAANEGFQNNVDSMVSRFNDISSSMARSTDSFQESAYNLQQQVQTVTEIVPKFTTAANQIESGSNLYMRGAERIEASKFSEHLESLTAKLANTQKSFARSTENLENQIQTIGKTQQETAELAQQIYTQLQSTSDRMQDSSLSFIEAAETFKASDFADKLTTATNELITIPQQFNDSTNILHSSTENIAKAIAKIDTSTESTNSLIERVNQLNLHSTKLLETSDRNIKQEIDGFNKIETELKTIVATLDKHKEQINESIGNFGSKILTNLNEQTGDNVAELKRITTGINNSSSSLKDTLAETAKLINVLEDYRVSFNSLNSQLSWLISTSEKQGSKTNINLEQIGTLSNCLLNSFEMRSQNSTKEMNQIATELKQTVGMVGNLIIEIKKMGRKSLYTSQTNSEANGIFQSFADLMSNAFMILCFLLLLVLFQSQKLNQELKEANKRLQSASPIVIDENSGKFKFKSGSAELNPQLASYIVEEISPTIKNILRSREIDFIQVIGHTDGQGTKQNSNLDRVLETVAQGSQPVSRLSAGSNADLGLMRALAVVQKLESSGLKNVEFRAYSAAQLYLPSGNLATVNRKPDETRRRIEIRFIPPGKSK